MSNVAWYPSPSALVASSHEADERGRRQREAGAATGWPIRKAGRNHPGWRQCRHGLHQKKIEKRTGVNVPRMRVPLRSTSGPPGFSVISPLIFAMLRS